MLIAAVLYTSVASCYVVSSRLSLHRCKCKCKCKLFTV